LPAAPGQGPVTSLMAAQMEIQDLSCTYLAQHELESVESSCLLLQMHHRVMLPSLPAK